MGESTEEFPGDLGRLGTQILFECWSTGNGEHTCTHKPIETRALESRLFHVTLLL